MTRRLSAKRTFLNNVMQQIEQHGETHAKVIGLRSWSELPLDVLLEPPSIFRCVPSLGSRSAQPVVL